MHRLLRPSDGPLAFRLLVCGLAALGLAACGTSTDAREAASRTRVTETDRSRAATALDLLVERYPSVRVFGRGSDATIRVRQYAHPPLVVIDGQRSLGEAAGVLSRIPAADVVDIEVKAAMGDTLVYGADAALGGVVEVTTRLGAQDRRD